MHPTKWIVTLSVLSLTAGLSGCASTPEEKVLEPVAAEAKAEPIEAPKPAVSPALDQCLSTLKARGYDGVGLEYEPVAALELLTKVFSDPKTGKRKIKRVYTGYQMAYDAANQALTVGGLDGRGGGDCLYKETSSRRSLSFIVSIPN